MLADEDVRVAPLPGAHIPLLSDITLTVSDDAVPIPARGSTTNRAQETMRCCQQCTVQRYYGCYFAAYRFSAGVKCAR